MIVISEWRETKEVSPIITLHFWAAFQRMAFQWQRRRAQTYKCGFISLRTEIHGGQGSWKLQGRIPAERPLYRKITLTVCIGVSLIFCWILEGTCRVWNCKARQRAVCCCELVALWDHRGLGGIWGFTNWRGKSPCWLLWTSNGNLERAVVLD